MTADRPRFARQFAMVKGRTRATVNIPMDSLLTAAKGTSWSDLSSDQCDIYKRCESPTSVAELASHLGVHLGIARVLVGDLIEMGALTMQAGIDDDDGPDLQTLEQVFNDLSNLTNS